MSAVAWLPHTVFLSQGTPPNHLAVSLCNLQFELPRREVRVYANLATQTTATPSSYNPVTNICEGGSTQALNTFLGRITGAASLTSAERLVLNCADPGRRRMRSLLQVGLDAAAHHTAAS